MTGRAGQRLVSLDVLSQAAAIRPSVELRNEAIACMALPDLRLAKEWEGDPHGTTMIGFDHPFERYAHSDPQGNISVRRISDDEELTILPGFGARCQWILRFSLDGKYLAAVYEGSSLCHVWDLSRHEVVWKTSAPVFQFALDISSDSQFLAAGEPNGAITIYELASGRQLKKLESDVVSQPHTMRYSPDGRMLAISTLDNPRVQIRDAESDVVLVTLPHPTGARGMAWHPDGKLLAAACADGAIRVWDVGTAKLLQVLPGHRGVVDYVEFSHDGQLLASTGWDDSFRLWDSSAGKQLLCQYDGHRQLRFSSDGRFLGFLCNGTKVGFYELATDGEVRTFDGRTSDIAVADFSPDGKLLAIAGYDGVRVWDLAAGREAVDFPLPERTFSIIFHPDGDSLFTSGHSGVFRWPITYDSAKPMIALRLGLPEAVVQLSNPEFACLSPDGETIVVTMPPFGPINAVGFKWREKQAPIEFRGHATAAFLAISPDSQWIATGTWSHDGSGIGVRVWDAETGTVVTVLPVDGNTNVLFSPSGRWLVTGNSQEYRFWEVGSWKPKHAVARRGAGDSFGFMDFSPDSKILALSHSRESLQLVEANTGRELATFAEDGQWPLSFSHNGEQLASGSAEWTDQRLGYPLCPATACRDQSRLGMIRRSNFSKISGRFFGLTSHGSLGHIMQP